jgi:pyruvate/2-oxoglutarate dehydrogenase complex dihydrolipoamide dehydrogenase (E3) component
MLKILMTSSTFLGVEVDAKGNIITDGFQNTSAANIYAVGDVIGKWQLTPGMFLFA